MKLTVFLIIEALLAYVVANQFCGKLEMASATRARREDGSKGRSLEVGYTGRIVVMVALLIGFAFIALLSKWLFVSTIVVMALTIGIVWGNIYLRGIGVEAFITAFFLWIGNIVASLYNQSKVGTESKWATFFIIFEIVMLALMAISTAVVKFNRYRMETREEDEAEEEDEELADHYIDEADDDESEADASEDDDEEDEDDYWEREARREKIIKTALNVFLIVLIVAAVASLGVWLEVKFDFFPPYRI